MALLVQAALAASIFRRGMARLYPAFAALIVFYPLRAILLFALSGRTAPSLFEAWSDVFSAAEMLLEIWLVVELTFLLTKTGGRWTAGRIRGGVAIVVSALAGAGVTLTAAPRRVAVDRTQVVFWWAMLALGAAALPMPRMAKRVTSPERNLERICAGFAIFSLFQLAALAGRTCAFAERSRRAYVGWSYVPAVAYIVVVMFWLVLLRRETIRGRKPAGAGA